MNEKEIAFWIVITTIVIILTIQFTVRIGGISLFDMFSREAEFIKAVSSKVTMSDLLHMKG